MAESLPGGYTCCIPGCFSNSKKHKGQFSFYVFPKDPKLRRKWLLNISRKNFSPTTGHRVCSAHFLGGKLKSYQNAVPTVFPLFSHSTAKGLVGIAPNGAVTFISDLYGGHVSDRKIVIASGILDMLEPHDSVMADWGSKFRICLYQRRCSSIFLPSCDARINLILTKKMKQGR